LEEGKTISIKAIILGVLTDIGGTFLFSVIFGILAGIAMAVKGITAAEMTERLEQPVFLISNLVIGLIFTLLGGLVAGRIAKRSELLHGGIVGGISIIFSLTFLSSVPVLYNAVALPLVIPAAVLGGFIARRYRDNTKTISGDRPLE
jgi:hypothetical protein